LTNVPINGTTVVTGVYTDDTPAGSGSAVLSANATIGVFIAGATVSPAAGDGTEIVSVSGSTITVTEDLDTLANQKTIVGTFQCLQAGVATFTLSHGGTTSPASVQLICGNGVQNPGYPGYYPSYPYGQYPYGGTGYPTYNTTVSTVSVTASPASTTCASPSTISITVTDSTGAVMANGASVTVSASAGTVSSNVVSTSNGIATTVWTAPSNSNGVATLTATSGTATGNATISFSCTGAATTTAPSQPVYVPPTDPYYPQAVGPVSIMPPNTGDAGLVGGSTTSNAGMALVAISVIGALTAGGLTLRHQRIER
jgi:hypothetical protein